MVTKEEVKNSMECMYLRRGLKLYLTGIAIFWALAFLMLVLSSENLVIGLSGFGIVVLLSVVLFSPFIFFIYLRYKKIINNYENYDVYEVILDEPKVYYGLGRRGGRIFYYNITFTTKDEKAVTTKTKPLWSESAFAFYDRRDYDKGKIKILYDERTGKVIVLGR